jgi:4-coumarate--CoA ligase
MVFYAYGGLHIDHIPDDLLVPDLILDPRYGRRPLPHSTEAPLIDAATGKSLSHMQLKERTEALTLGLLKELGVEVGWKGAVGVFAPNHVNPSLVPSG